MSKAVNTDHEFKINVYADLLSKAKGGRSQTEFAKDCGLSVAYICKHLNKRITTPPIPSTLKKIAAAAANGVTYIDLLDAAGYDAAKYTLQVSTSSTDEQTTNKDHEQSKKLALATITGELSRSKLQWSLKGASEEAKLNYDIDVELAGNKLTHWYFKFVSTESKTSSLDNSTFFNRMCAYYGRIVFMPTGKTTKYSFVTDSQSVFDLLKTNTPTSLAMYVSVILIDTASLSIVKEELIKTAFSDKTEGLFIFS